MLDNATITNYIKWGDISLYLSKDDLETERYYSWINETKKCRLIYLVKESLKFAQPYYN